MELILKSDSESSIAKIIALAKTLNVSVEQRGGISQNKDNNEELINSILNFKASGESSFGDAVEWQKAQRSDRDLPFSQ
ncbi:MAG: hypothetical protein ABIN13_05000 [Mucilaginibacter sp.]